MGEAMGVPMFASIYIGSYEVNLKIFEFTVKKQTHEVEFVSSRVNLGRDILTNGKVGYEVVEDLCLVLNEFRRIIDSYHITDYKAYCSTVLTQAENYMFVIDQIRIRTGFLAAILSNSEHRFLSYKAMAGQETFDQMIQTSAAVVDVGGASIQITLFRKGDLLTTQHMEIGTMRLKSLLDRPGVPQDRYEKEIEEFINKRLEVFHSLYCQSGVDYIVYISDYGVNLMHGLSHNSAKEVIRAEKMQKYTEQLLAHPLEQITGELNLSDDRDPMIIPAIMLFKEVSKKLDAKEIWFPGVDINDGIAYDYAQNAKLIRVNHDFEADVLSAARHIAEHYKSHSPHIEALRGLATQIFDTMKKVHGMGKRERLLLQVATMLHDVGKYVSFSNGPECAYQIIKSTEIIGLSHNEREMVGLIVLYNTLPLDDYDEVSDIISRENFVTVAKLAAILRVANALDQSHKQKFKNSSMTIKDRQLVISIEAFEDISLEQMLFDSKTEFFESVFSMKPVLKGKRVYKNKK